jgi:uncharacterized protein
MDSETIVVVNNSEKHRFEVLLGDEVAMIQYQRSDGIISYTHAEVPKAFEGRGIATKMAFTAMEYARENGLKVRALCPFVADYVHKHPEYHSITQGYEQKA